MLYSFELSGEHAEIPRAEVISCLERQGLTYSIASVLNRCLVLDINAGLKKCDKEKEREYIEHILKYEIASALAMTHAISRVVSICDTDETSILQAAESLNAATVLGKNQTFAVRVSRLGDQNLLKSVNIEGKIGGRIYRQGFRADLKNPDVMFRITLTNKAVLGILIERIDRGAYECRSPQKKPFFYPGVLMPRLARALCNIAGAGKKKIVLDPFCGTAGILLEAGLVGAIAIGVDAQQKIISGAVLNFEGYDVETGNYRQKDDKVADYVLMVGDACRLPIQTETIDAIITDPPYGRSAAIKADSLDALYSNAFKEMYRVLKPGKKGVVVSEISVVPFARQTGFEIKNIWKQRVHKSLTRTITVIAKKEKE